MLLDYPDQQDFEEWSRMIDVNVKGVLAGTKAVLADMMTRNEGTIINISSIAGRKTFDNHSVYSHIFSAGNSIQMSGRCMYCNHCQPCPAHIDIAAVTKFLDLATQQDTVPETVAQHYHSLSATADDCLMCGRC